MFWSVEVVFMMFADQRRLQPFLRACNNRRSRDALQIKHSRCGGVKMEMLKLVGAKPMFEWCFEISDSRFQIPDSRF